MGIASDPWLEEARLKDKDDITVNDTMLIETCL
jgi:hypothetical protein